MGKNYFTDEQVKQILQKVETNGNYVTVSDYKALMNLAVEVAIGNPKAQAYINFQNECEQIEWFEGHNIKVDDEFIPLYSVKELEN